MRKHFYSMMAPLLAFAIAAPALSYAGGPSKGSSPSAVQQIPTEVKKGFKPMLTKTRNAYKFTGPLTRVYSNSTVVMAPEYANDNNLPTIYGNVPYSDDDAFVVEAMYKIPLTQGSNFEYVGGNGIVASRGGIEVGDRYMAHSMISLGGGLVNTYYIKKYDTTFWDQKASNSSVKVGTMATDLALDPTDNTVYGCFYNDKQDGYVLGKMDYSAYKRTIIADLQTGWNACAFDASGQLYAVDVTGTLVKVNKENGEITTVGSTGIVPKYLTSACIDPASGRMFWSVCPADETGKLYEVNLTTGAATLVCHFPDNEQVVGMYIPTPLAADNAPAAVANLQADFPQGTLEGNVTFDAPTTNFDGTPASGELSYTVMNKTTKVAEGTTSYGTHTSVPVTIGKAGKCEFIVTVANAEGTSPKSRVIMFVGKDKPKTPVVSAVYADGVFTVSWDPITESVNGGYMNADAITYKVVRYPDNTTIAEATTETSLTDEVATPENEYIRYYYTVTASSEGMESDKGESNAVGLGQLIPPYSEGFETKESILSFTIIDGNKDGKTWAYNNKKARLNYTSKAFQDDWLITPPIKLEKNKIYKFSMDVTTAKSYTERFEVMFGKNNTVEALTNVVIEAQDVNAGDGHKFIGYVKADEDCLYYIGIHGISKTNQFYLDVDNLSLEEGTSALVPEAPTGLTITPDKNGELKATVKFMAPAKNLLGTALQSLTKIEIMRDGEIINTVNQPSVGNEQSYEDNTVATGKHIYTIVAYNEEGRGWEAIDSAFIGINTPTAPVNIVAKETANVGEVTISWQAPESDIDGFSINPALITYDLIGIRGEEQTTIASGLTDLTHTYQAVSADTPQQFYYYQVVAKTSAGSTPGVSASIAVGKADTAPYFESFANGQPTHAIDGAPIVGDTNWAVYSDTNDLGVTAADNDNGFAASRGEHGLDAASIFTGKIDLSGLNNPIVTFYAYNIFTSDGKNSDRNTLEIIVDDRNSEKSLGIIAMNEFEKQGWNKAQVSLKKFVGKTVSIKWISVVNSFSYTLIDNIRVVEWLDYNLTASAIQAPKNVEPNTDFNVTVTIENSGSKKATDYTIELYRNDELIGTKAGEEMEPQTVATVEFTTSLSVVDDVNAKYHAVVNYSADLDNADNTTDEITTALKLPKYPTASGLTAVLNEQNTVVLNWNEPETDAVAEAVTESFENAEPFAINDIEDWTFIDVDGDKTYGFTGVAFPNSGSPMAYIALDGTFEGFEGVGAHTGNISLGCFASVSKQNDDWAISPLLDGLAQKVSFYAKSFDFEMAETFEFLYSTTGTAKEDFILVNEVANVPEEWTKYEFDVPQGGKYFAIRCTSNDKFIFMVDDINFTPAGPGAGLTLVGYNVYRDGVKINETPVEEPSFTDSEVDGGNHSYVVSVVYDKGESAPSNSADVIVTGIEGVVDSMSAVSVEGRAIVVSNAEGMQVTIVAMDGKIIYNTKATSDRVKYEVESGLYVVSVSGKATKVIVR